MQIGTKTKFGLLCALKDFCLDATKNFRLPTAVQKNAVEEVYRSPEVYIMRLVDSNSAKQYAPYIIIQFVNGIDRQPTGQPKESSATVRFVFCVYDANEETGAINLINVMDSVSTQLQKKVIIGNSYKLDVESGIESLVYFENTAPYFAGELIATFILPPVEREVPFIHGN